MKINRFKLLLSFVALATFTQSLRADETFSASQLQALQAKGLSIYNRQCLSCHGKNGQGVVGKHPDALLGDSTIAELSQVITETMPEKNSKACVGPDAQAVATYIYHAFYSRAAQIRNRPPRISLARLTGPQLRQSLADLYAHFEGITRPVDKHGLAAQYYTGSRPRKGNQKIDRIDPVLDFDFADKGPGQGIDAKDFYIQWQGGIKADVSGRYTLIIRSTCAFVCDFGRIDRQFINNHVQSGDKTEFRRSISLTAGRVYPIRIKFYQRKRKTKQPPAKIKLLWIPPHGVEQVIPHRQLLTTTVFPGAFPLQAYLPPDDRSYGYERGIAVDRQWDKSTTDAAVEFGHAAASELWPRYQRRYQKGSPKGRAVLRDFLTKLAQIAFRGALDEAARKFYVDAQSDATQDDAEAIRRSVLACLKSPRFLYPLLDTDQSTSQRTANRLALTLFDSLPSEAWLLKEVEKGGLDKADRIRNAARRMVSDFRTQAKTRQLMYAWLNMSHIEDIKKDDRLFPGFDDQIAADLRGSLDAFLDDIVWSESSDYRQLFKADWSYTNNRLAGFYKTPAWKPLTPTKNSALSKSASDSEHRSGLLTHPYLMSGLAYRDSTSPVHRGVFLIRFVLGRTLRPPNEAFTPLSPKLHPDLTTRERVELQTSPANCQVCHTKINGLGFALENFDAVGRFRVKERDKIIDSAGRYTTRSGKVVSFKGSRELADYLVSSEDAHQAFVSRAFQHFVKQPIAAYGPDMLNNLTATFKKKNFNIRELLIEIAVIAASQPDNREPKTVGTASRR